VTADLLRAPPLRQQLGDQLPQVTVGLDAPPMIAGSARGCAAVCLQRPVRSAAQDITAQLTRDRRRHPAQLVSDLPDAKTCAAQIGDLDPLVLRQDRALI
jgi:hypothetical protein